MPFTAECYFCHLKIQNVPDRHRGVSKQCPRCKNQLTLAEMSSVRPMPVMQRGDSSTTPDFLSPNPQEPLEPFPDRRPDSSEPRTPVVASTIELAAPEGPEPKLVSVRLPARIGNTRSRTGLFALCFASLAFMLTTVQGAAWVSAGLALLALICASLCLLSTLPRSRNNLAAFPGLAIGFGVLISLAYSHREEFWHAFKSRRALDLSPAQALVHLRTEGVTSHIEAKELNWVDAASDAAQVGNIRVRVVSAALEAVGPATASTRRTRPEKRLVVRLRISNAGASKLEHYRGWNDFTTGSGEDRLRLSDDSGKAIRPLRETSIGSSKVIKDAEIPPEKWIDDFVIFEVPAARTGDLRLELPGAAIGSKEKLSFRIPNNMLQHSGDGPPGKVRVK